MKLSVYRNQIIWVVDLEQVPQLFQTRDLLPRERLMDLHTSCH